ncbi:MAG: 2-hydroxyacyl-CoA dehydratase [Proteobacteria bacterium]|nr:2-hydroxyacyl-CoA dehydratase [Pseudomonadota bacterium]
MESFKRIYDNRHEYIGKWKEKHPDRKIMGYMCTSMPEEIIYAANALPIRILGGHESQNVSQQHMMGTFCPFSRDVLAQGLLGKYDYLDALGITHTCQHIYQAYESWVLHKNIKSFYIPTPNTSQTPHALPYLRGQLKLFLEKLEDWTGRKIGENDLRRGIEIVDTTRKLMKQIYEMRKSESPPISGLDSMLMVVAAQMSDKEEFNTILEDVIKNELPGRKAKATPSSRLMLIGSEHDDVKFIEMVENLDAIIVIDDHCTGSRYFWNTTEQNEDALTDIANRYIKKPPCPIKDFPVRKRTAHIVNLANEWNVAGVIEIQQKFCDPHELDRVAVSKALEKAGFPILNLEADVTMPVGPFRIRVEAFLEILSSEELF